VAWFTLLSVHVIVDLPPLQALQRTLEFEEELAEKFGGGTVNSRNTELGNDVETTDEGGNNDQIISDIRRKYEKRFAEQRGGGNEHVRTF